MRKNKINVKVRKLVKVQDHISFEFYLKVSQCIANEDLYGFIFTARNVMNNISYIQIQILK